MKYAELSRKLRQLGCEFVRDAAGSHEIWRNPATRRQAPIPYHRSKDIGPTLLATILRQLEIDRQEFNKA